MNKYLLQPVLFLLFAIMLSACEPLPSDTHMQQIKQRGVLRVGTLNTPVSYLYEGEQLSGLDYELAIAFAERLDVKLDMSPALSIDELFKELDTGNIDLIAAGLTLTPERANKYRSAPPFYEVAQTLVYRTGSKKPRKFEDIDAPVLVLKSSAHEEFLTQLKSEHPHLSLQAIDEEDPAELLKQVEDSEASYALVNDVVLARSQRYYPNLAEGFSLENKEPVAWLLKKNIDDSLYAALIEYIGEQHQAGVVAKLEEKYFGHIKRFDFVDTRSFLRAAENVLPDYKALFEKYQTEEFDWILLAATSYQESHWKPNAKSRTGVRGMMMLTNNTAKMMGVKNRVDAEESVRGGAKYLTYILSRIPDSIDEDEKIWFALASYNLGFGHVMDARRLARSLGKDQDNWSDVKDILPLLQRKKWHQKTRYGYARGGEAKHYVNNIRQYQESLTWLVRKQARDKLFEQQLALHPWVELSESLTAPNSTLTDETTTADKKPVTEEKPSAAKGNKEPSASKKPSASKEPSAGKEPSASKKPSAGKKPSATKAPVADEKPIKKEPGDKQSDTEASATVETPANSTPSAKSLDTPN
ncbi:membrane-bound lytic murein transglycosylase MltF [Motilimonas pumila]|uniref:membrane-bound lytic murein transglycosylase MltF n=1 Tax=Motilimonas pumila TaxID=2303987 RepID=UPI001314B7BB|nr:membrane-bound lytic murein transglycosylase MltF [Motilimonas pumila]